VFVAKPFTDYTAEDYGTVIGVNLAEFFNVTQRVIEDVQAGYQERREYHD
jgi:hypothetical protein